MSGVVQSDIFCNTQSFELISSLYYYYSFHCQLPTYICQRERKALMSQTQCETLTNICDADSIKFTSNPGLWFKCGRMIPLFGELRLCYMAGRWLSMRPAACSTAQTCSILSELCSTWAPFHTVPRLLAKWVGTLEALLTAYTKHLSALAVTATFNIFLL